MVKIAEANLNNQKNALIKNVSFSFFDYQILLNKLELYQTLDSLYAVLLVNSEKRAANGDVSRLEVMNIKAKKNQTSIQLNALKVDAENAYHQLKVLMNYEGDFSVSSNIEPLAEISEIPNAMPVFDVLKNETEYYNSLVRIEKNKILPDFSINYFLGSNQFQNSKHYHGFQVGVAFPLFYGSSRAKIKASKISANAKQLSIENKIRKMNRKILMTPIKFLKICKN